MSENLELVLVSAKASPWYAWDHSGWYWAMGAHGVIWFMVIALIVATAVILTQTTRRVRSNTAMSALDTRDARGAIDRGGYLQRRRDLE